MSLTFEWDEFKAIANLKKHKGVSFDEGKTVFNDPFLLTLPDTDNSENEERYINIGLSAKGRVLVLIHHDQGHIPTKIIGFQYDAKTNTWGSISGVNITCGLPIIRVSVDHGTAFGKAGEGRANPESLVDALRIASRFASPG